MEGPETAVDGDGKDTAVTVAVAVANKDAIEIEIVTAEETTADIVDDSDNNNNNTNDDDHYENNDNPNGNKNTKTLFIINGHKDARIEGKQGYKEEYIKEHVCKFRTLSGNEMEIHDYYLQKVSSAHNNNIANSAVAQFCKDNDDLCNQQNIIFVSGITIIVIAIVLIIVGIAMPSLAMIIIGAIVLFAAVVATGLCSKMAGGGMGAC